MLQRTCYSGQEAQSNGRCLSDLVQESFVPGRCPAIPIQAKHSPGCKLARFLCALAVMFWHYQVFFVYGIGTGVELPANQVEKFPFYWLFSFFYDNGHFAVPIFWMISGFNIFLKYSAPVHNGRVSAYQFFGALLFSPLSVAFRNAYRGGVVQLTYIRTHGTSFRTADNDAFHFALQLIFASNWINALPQTFNGPIWSVSVEVLVYAFFLIVVSFLRPSLILCLCRRGGREVCEPLLSTEFLRVRRIFFRGRRLAGHQRHVVTPLETGRACRFRSRAVLVDCLALQARLHLGI